MKLLRISAATLTAALAVAGCSSPEAPPATVYVTAEPSPSSPAPPPSPIVDEDTLGATEIRNLLGEDGVEYTIAATRTAKPSEDAAGNKIRYGVNNLVDGEKATAWRASYDYWYWNDDYVLVTFSEPVVVTEVGLIPGYAKVDKTSGVDRFYQNRRIRWVTWVMSDGSEWKQKFQQQPKMQTNPVAGEVTWVKILIVDVWDYWDEAEREFIAISEIKINGYPAEADE